MASNITREDLVEAGVDSVETFVNYLLEVEDTASCSPGACQVLAGILGKSVQETIQAVKAAGITMALNGRVDPNRRGHSAPLNGTPRFSGENSTHTTPSGSNVCGFAGNAGW